MKWLGKYGDEAAEAGAKAVQNADSGLLSGLKEWWNAPYKLKPKYIKETLDVSLDDIYKMSDDSARAMLSGSEFAKSIDDKMYKAARQLSERRTEARRALNRAEIELRNAKNELATMQRTRQDLVDPARASQLEDQIEYLAKQHQDTLSIANKIQELESAIATKGYGKALQMVEQDPVLRGQIPDTWRTLLNDTLRSKMQIARAQSPYLNDTKKFLKQYRGILEMPENNAFRKAWEANAENQNKVSSLWREIKKMTAKETGKGTAKEVAKAARPSLFGKATSIAKKLGLGAGALAGGAGALALYRWFDSNDPVKTAAGASNITSDLRRIKTTDPRAAEVVNNAINALSNLNTAAGSVSMGMGVNPQQTTSRFISTTAKELQAVNSALANWATVQYGSQDPEYAQKTGEKLAQYANKVGKDLQALGKELGVGVQDVGVAGMESVNINPNIKQIQSFLKQHVDSSIEATGRLDDKTTRILRNIEDYFNKRAETSDWTGALIQPNGQIVPYNKLVEAFDRIKKY